MLNEKICFVGGANTGFGICVVDPKNFVGLFMVPPGTGITETDLEDLNTYLTGKVNNDIPSNRFYPIHGFVGVEDNSEGPTEQGLGYGGTAITREGEYDLTFQFLEGAMCLHKSLRKFNGTQKDVFLVDANGMLIGSNINGVLRSIPLTLLYIPPFTINNGTDTAAYKIRMKFQSKWVNEDLGFVDTSAAGLVMSAYRGLQNLMLVVVDNTNFPVVRIKAVAGCDRENLFDKYEEDLEVAGLWIATLPNGESLTVDTVVAHPGSKSFDVTVTDGETDTFTSFYLQLVAPTALATGGVTGYESRRVLVVEP